MAYGARLIGQTYLTIRDKPIEYLSMQNIVQYLNLIINKQPWQSFIKTLCIAWHCMAWHLRELRVYVC